MNASFKCVALVVLFTCSLGLVSFTDGCAGVRTQESTGEYVDDSSITVKVKAAFIKDPIVKALDVKVETSKGVVQLSGSVGSDVEKAQAAKVAATVNGVVEVKNNISVK